MPRTTSIDAEVPFSMRETEHDWTMDFTEVEKPDAEWSEDADDWAELAR